MRHRRFNCFSLGWLASLMVLLSAFTSFAKFTTNTVSSFTNNAGGELITNLYSAAGMVTRRIWKNAAGTATNRKQILYWDAKLRLHEEVDYDAATNSYVWLADYDGLDRRLLTQWYAMNRNSTMKTALPTTTRRSVARQRLALIYQAMDACRTAGTIAHLPTLCRTNRRHSMLPVALAAHTSGIIHHEMTKQQEALTALHQQRWRD